MEERPFINRILISLVTALSFVAMSLSGIAAFIVPQGKVAYWTHWTFLGLSKPDWGNIHITTSVLFLIAGIWHTWYNWTPLMQYLHGIPGRVTASWRDLAVATLITLFFAVGAIYKAPPLNYILNLNSWIKESWVKTPAYDPPFGHAELLSLKGFCKKMYIDTGDALRELRKVGLAIIDENMTIEQIARSNRLTPASVYQVIKKLERPDVPAAAVVAYVNTQPTGRPGSSAQTVKNKPGALPVAKEAVALPRYTGDMVVEKFEGKGIGRKTLPAICQELNLDYVRIKQKLASKQMEIKEDESLKDAATRQGVMPIELLKSILVGEVL